MPRGLENTPAGATFDKEVRDATGTWHPPSGPRVGRSCVVVWCRWLPAFELRDATGNVTRGAWQVQWKKQGSRTVSHVGKEDVRVFCAAPAVPNHALLVGATAPAPTPAAAVVDLTQDAAPARARSPRAQTLGPCRPGVEGPKSIFTAPTGPRRAERPTPAPARAPAPAPPPLPPFDPLATAPAPAADDEDWRRRLL